MDLRGSYFDLVQRILVCLIQTNAIRALDIEEIFIILGGETGGGGPS